MIQRLKNKFRENEPIFIKEILEEFNDYSRARVFQIIKKFEEQKELIRFDTGIYYIPKKTRFGLSNISVEQVIRKKYISYKNDVYGIYGGITLKTNYLLSYQVPVTLEIITNKETMWSREIKIKNRKIIIKKSRTEINNNNVFAYTILELFSDIDMTKYKEDESVQREIKEYIKENAIKGTDILILSTYFPSKSLKNIIKGGLINDFA